MKYPFKIKTVAFYFFLIIVFALQAKSENSSDPNNNVNQYFGPISLENKTMGKVEALGPLDAKRLKIVKLQVKGPMTGEQIEVKKLIVHGPADLSENKITKLNVSGPAQLSNTIVDKKVHIKGPLTLTNNSICKGPVKVFGPINAKDSIFTNHIISYSNNNSFENVSGQKLIIKKSDSKRKDIVTLKNSKFTEITFESGNGQIQVDSASKVGKIKGGVTKKLEEEE